MRAEPGGRIPLRYHSHDRQEEAVFVLSGTLHVEPPDEPVKLLAIGTSPTDDARPYDPSSG